ncbi:pentatricopeptide repeat-containing protein At5g04780, mitochondrial-like [Hordeum vulgare subsp. vulgare]|uniref:DYW domain-containing protein n=1 Tax=Hordeum vulgare subsp. vulgare TaxID=112509 RepID=A0A8I6WPC2_HORVV|nr:pentatricopeptide repeat-containing protein At5g04780, mitochondrial-like [Hordeum vulgare subsp. vulgare]
MATTMLPSPSLPPTPRGVLSPRCSLQAPTHAHRVPDGASRRQHAPVQQARPEAAAYAREIGACVRARRWGAACEAFAAMRAAGAEPDRFLLPQVLRACAGADAPRLAAAAHALAAKGGPALADDAVVGNAVVAMYAALGDVRAARAAFASLPERDVVAWTALVGAYANAGELDQAFELFESMQANGVRPDVISWNNLVSGFARNGDIGAALDLFDEMRLRGVKPRASSWNCIISGCVQNARYDEALGIFLEMCETEMPDAVTIASILPACTGLMALGLGKQLHSYVVRCGIKLNVYIGSSLIGMYSECREFAYATSVFSAIDGERNVTVWNELIQSYISDGRMDKACEAFNLMQQDGLKPDTVTYNSFVAVYARAGQKELANELLLGMMNVSLKPNVVSLNALISGLHQFGLCADALEVFRYMQLLNSGDAKRWTFLDNSNPIQPNGTTITSVLSLLTDLKLDRLGKEVHCYALRNGLTSNIFVSSKLVDLYGKTGDMVSAANVFQGIRNKNVVTWNSLLAAYKHNRKPEVVLKLFCEMLESNLLPNLVTVQIALLSSGMTMASGYGGELHGYIQKNWPDGYPVTLASALIDMYGKCGKIEDARLAFECSVDKDIAVWNAMMSCYLLHRMPRDVKRLFEMLEQSRTRPDPVTFIILLSACKQEGSMVEARSYFYSMEDSYGIKPSLKHYTCMVDIMGTAGLLEESLELIQKMPVEPDACLWSTVLKACKIHSDLEVAAKAAKALFELEPNNASNYMLLSNIYANSGFWDLTESVRDAMTEHGLHVESQCSWLYLGTSVDSFEAGDLSHPAFEDILSTWKDLASRMAESGYAPQDDEPYCNVQVDPLSCHHTERIAVCYGLISMCAHEPIRVLKNFRMCKECHSSIKFISRDKKREILISDGCTYHHFSDGSCSCGDMW